MEEVTGRVADVWAEKDTGTAEDWRMEDLREGLMFGGEGGKEGLFVGAGVGAEAGDLLVVLLEADDVDVAGSIVKGSFPSLKERLPGEEACGLF